MNGIRIKFPNKMLYINERIKRSRICNPIILLIIILFILISGCNKRTAHFIDHTGKQDYTKIFNDAFSKYNYVIIKPGTYHLKAPIYLQNNIIIVGEGSVILIKDTTYSHVFVNQKATKDYTKEWNRYITIKNITIDDNNKGSQCDAAHSTANGILSFKFLDNLTLENVKIINGDKVLFGVHLQSVKNVKVKNYFYDGNKDGFHINGGCEDIVIDGFDISSYDDAFGIMTDDYPRVQSNAKDLKNIIIKNGISRKRIPQAGFFLRLMTGSWCNWEKGNKYKVGNTVNYQHNQYKKLNTGECISLGPPNHSKGDSLYSDGIVWRYIGKGVNKTSNIYNIYVKNVQLEDGRQIVRTVNDDSYDYGEYPGTEYASIVDGLYISGYPFTLIWGKMGKYYTSDYSIYKVVLLILFLILIVIFTISFSRHIKFTNKFKTILTKIYGD